MARFIITGEYKDKATKLARKDLQNLSKSTIDYGRIAKKYWGIASAAVLYYTQRALRASINAAVEDEKTQRSLAFTLTSVAKANEAAVIASEANIKSMSMMYGIADDELRPSLQSLIRVTGNLGESSRSLDLALALSAASGQGLEKTTRAISRAYLGNYKALKSLGFVIDEKLIKEKDTSKILKTLQRQYGDFARNQLNTTAVQYAKIRVAAGEASEVIGVALVDSLNRFLSTSNGIDGVAKKFEAMAQYVADVVTGITDVIMGVQRLGDYIPDIVKSTGKWVGQNLTILGVLQKQGKQTRINLALQKAQTQQVISARNAEMTALKAKTEIVKKSDKTIDQLIAEEAARKAGFKITEDIDSIQTVAAAKRLQEARQYKAQVLDAAQAQFDAVKSNYDLLNAVWQTQLTAFDAFLAALKLKAEQSPIAINYQGTGAGSAPSAPPPIAAVVPEPTTPQFLGGGGSFGTERLALGGNTNIVNMSVNSFGTQDFLSAVQLAQQEFARNGWSTGYAGG